jgi:O-antigen/teichoic acid export membrane protein
MLDLLKSTAKSTFIYSLGNFSSRLAGFILIPMYTSHLSLAEFGIMGMLEISSQIVIAVLGLGLYNAFFRWYWDKQYEGQQKSILYTILVSIAGASAIIILPCILARNLLANLLLESSRYGNLIVLLFVVSSIEAIIVIISTLFRIKNRAFLFSTLMVLKLVITLVLNIYFVVVLKKSVEGVYIAQMIGGIFYIITALFFMVKDIEFKFQKQVLKQMMIFSYPLLIVAITGIILNITDRYSLRFLTNLDEVGKYSLGFKISNTIRVFIITSVNLALQPTIFRMIDQPNNKKFYSKIMTYYSFGLMFCVLFISLFSQEIVKVLSKNVLYWSSYQIIPLLSLSMFFTMLRDVALTGINISKKTNLTARIITICMVVNILLCFLFVYLFKSIGAALAATLSQILFFVLVYRFAQKVYFIPYEFQKILRLIVVSVLIYLASMLLSKYSLFLRLSLKSTMIIAFPFILYLVKFYDPIEIERIKQFWLKWRNISNIINNFKSLKHN